MGIGSSKCCTKHYAEQRQQRAKISVLEEEMEAMIRREKEQRQVVLAWERRKLKDEVAGLRLRVKEEEEIVRRLEAVAAAAIGSGGCGGGGVDQVSEHELWEMIIRDGYIMEEMREEQERKEASVEKWKQLYFAVKADLHQLILLTTNHGEMLCWGSEQAAMVESLKTEVKAKEEALEALRAKLRSLERQGARREGENDILRQSLKILTSANRNTARRNHKKRFLRL